MECCLTESGKICMEKLIDKAIAELRHVFCFTSTANEFREKKTWLEAEIKTMEQHAKVAAGNDKDIEADYHLWKEKAEKLVQEDILTKQKCFFGLCPNCIWRYKKGKELANNIQDIKQLTEKRGTFENIEISRRLPDVERYSSKDYISFPSRDSKYKELLDALKNDNNYMIVLQGMGGTGKTTLAKEVGKELKKSEQFAHVIDTTVSFTPDTKKIQDDIAGSLGLEWDDCNDSDRPKKLWSRLTTDEKVLLIMDDVWDQGSPLDFDLIGIPKQDNHKGCRVLITTRSKQIFNIMGCDKMIELDILPEEEAWTMFKMYACIIDNSSISLIATGREIAKECKQLPVAIAVIARSLKGQQDRKHKWDTTLKLLKETVSMDNVDEEKVGIYKCLKSSYDGMKYEKAKGLFLLSSVFPEDKEIPIEILTRLGIGTGLFGKNYGNYNDARNQVVVAKDKLIDSCLLVGVGEEHVKMHDLVREAAQWIAYKEIRHVNLSNKDEKSSAQKEKNMKYLFCEGKDMDLFSLKYDGSKLETLILDVEMDEDRKYMEAPNSFFDNIDHLQVLYILGHDNRTLSLPYSISSLANIVSILVDGVDLGDISIFANLQSLETLDLVKCKINELPREIAKLGKLKLLNLERCEITRNDPFEVIGRCSTLEELYLIDSFNDFCREITLPELKMYHIQKGRRKLLNSLSKYVSFDAGRGECFFSKDTFKYCMHTTEGLDLNGIKEGWRNLMPEIVPIDSGMKDLVELRLSSISQLQCLIDSVGSQVPNIFPNLVVLKVSTMENLVELFNGSLSFDSLKNLEKLSIKKCKMFQRLFNCKLNLYNLKTVTLCDCPMLVNLSSLLTSRNLMLLEKLKIVDCEGLTNIIIEEGSKEHDNGKKSSVSMFPKLKVVEIEGCQLLESILPFLSSQDLPILEALRIRRCHKLEYIFGQYVELSSLKEIDLCELPNFMAIFPKSSTSRDGFKEQTHVDPVKCNLFSWSCKCWHMSTTKVPSVHEDSLQKNSTPSVSNSQCLQLWERAQCLPVQSHIMCNIKEIKLSGFLKIKSLFIFSITPVMLVETLTISKCDELEYIIADIGDDERGGNNWGNAFPKLKQLYVNECMQLKYLFGHYTNDHPNLHLPALQYLKLRNLPSLVAICPKQYCTPFPPLEQLDISECCQVAIKSIGEFIINHSESESLDNTIIKGSSSHHIQIWDRAQCFQARLLNMCNVKEITLCDISMIKWVLIMSITPTMLVETLTIKNCNELKHIIVDIGDDDSDGNNWCKVFPKLKTLRVESCKKLEYIFGHYTDDHHNHSKIHLHLSALQSLTLNCLPSLVAICPKQYCTTFPPFKNLRLSDCSEVAIKSIGEFIINHSESESLLNTITKVSGSIENFVALESLWLHKSKAENILCLNEIEGEPLNLRLRWIYLYDLHYMMYLFVGPKNSFALQNLTRITIRQCEILEVVFSTSILRCISQLRDLIILNCKQLKHIIEDDRQNQNLSLRTCFPKLKTLSVIKCHKLKYVFLASTCKELLRLENLMIIESDELEEIFKCEGDQKVEIPNLNILVLDHLPSLFHTQGILFQAAKNRYVHSCQNLSLTSASTPFVIHDIDRHYIDLYTRVLLKILFKKLQKESTTEDTCNENSSGETTKDDVASVGIETEAVLGHETTYSQKLEKEQSMSQQGPLGEINTTIKPPQSVEEETALTDAKILTTSTHLELISSSQEQDFAVRDSLETVKLNDDQGDGTHLERDVADRVQGLRLGI
ncbi:unnamed protein product [Vicia faba]|uniref:NB-ARC domain-containing protein n=1 Tax=Vicia faba TaxID=3906 RepID=A0AAV0ZB71_VICFA|nr:unnamed protein product [Vicia faba]